MTAQAEIHVISSVRFNFNSKIAKYVDINLKCDIVYCIVNKR